MALGARRIQGPRPGHAVHGASGRLCRRGPATALGPGVAAAPTGPACPHRTEMKTTKIAIPDAAPVPTAGNTSRLPLRGWALELARRWNSAAYTVFVLHGNIFDVFPVLNGERIDYLPLKSFLADRLFPARDFLLFYDIGDGLTFGSADMQKRFFEWLEIYDQVENTNFHQAGPPREFIRLAPLLRRFFLRLAGDKRDLQSVTLIIDFPEKIIPAQLEAGASLEERMALVTLLKWAAAPEMRQLDLGVILVAESAAELRADLLQNPNVAQVKIELPISKTGCGSSNPVGPRRWRVENR